MKKKTNASIAKRIFYFILTLCVIGAVCIGVYAYSLMNNPDVITLGEGESYTLSTRESEYKVRSYNANVIAPSVGSTVKASSVGEAVLCVKYSYFDRDFYRFNVISAPTSVTLNKEELTLGVKESYKLSASCSTFSHDFAVSFSSSDESVATVSQNGYVTALKTGECVITASAYNGKTDSCTISVKNAPFAFNFSESSVTLGEGETLALEPIFENDEYAYSLEFISSDEKIATFNDDNTLNAISVGECTVSAKAYNGVTAQCKVEVKKMAEKLSLVVLDEYDVDSVIRVITDIPEDCGAYNIDISVSDETVLSIDEKNDRLIHPLKQGECTITATLSNGVTDSKTVTIGDYEKGSVSLNSLNQFPTLPTGCEVVSLTSVLNFYGEDVSMTTMADEYMPKSEYNYFGVSPHDYFLGTPYTWDGFGCFSGCIVKTANNYFEDKNIDDYIALDISGCSLDELYNYLSNGTPVITWVTSGFVTPTVDGSWTVGDETIKWCNHEHCLVTTGYDKNEGTVTVADNSGGYSYSLSMSQYEEVFKGMGSMAVVILKK